MARSEKRGPRDFFGTREVNLLGTATDAAIAAKLGRSVKSIETARLRRNIPPLKPHRREWSKRELALLGTMSDAKLAAKLGVTPKHVLETRQRHGVPAYSSKNRPKSLP